MPAALIVTTLGLFLATGMLYVTQTQHRALLSATVRSSGWVAYQAQLEFVKTQGQFEIAMLRPSRRALDELQFRLELLRSRLPLLYDSDEGRLLQEVAAQKDVLQAFERTLDATIDSLPDTSPSAPETVARLRGAYYELEPLGRVLQKVLMQSIAYNEEIFRREREVAASPAIVPFALLFVSGTCLVAILFMDGRRDRQRLADVTAAKAEVTAVQDNLRAIIEAMPIGTIIVDPDGDQVRFINPSAAALVDPSPDHPEWRRLIRAAFEAAIDENGRKTGTLSMAFAKPLGDIVSLRGAVCGVIWEGRPQILILLTDTSRVRNAELQLMQAAKLATLGEMATAIAHELNQPLAVIKMAVANARRLVLSEADPEAITSKLDRIGAQVDRAKRITDQVRRYARMPGDQTASFVLRQAVELAAGFVAEQYRAAGIRMVLDLEVSPELLVSGDQTMFEQVIVNLLINSRDAYDSQRQDTHQPQVVVRAVVRGGEVVIEVTDDAGGIRNDILGNIFDPFCTTKSAEKGTGLGLSMARNVVRDMNGTIAAENVEGGARFTIVLPAARTQAQDVA
ncbi:MULTISPECIES: sensor histidine kinase [Azorhizobium]|uniref:histidine kinase n=1 Tax=Azorhizobium caulinodans (strain ATCC 43989 / DSM 5975 / JCM 20966 / LMG 6465 / NBRC 14845 / NCIMB 13405 / ORS 571) TaxID=438753 RepID=A8IPF4_AZOC5|nr:MULTISPECIES: ATP-binding protein [Azorhizobium]TDT88913.1 PAS domain-containing protein [Azorhizobium sp. AG788]BAF86613.1 sensor protein [Azorhizobium caulinodans ORS 571]